MAERPDDRRHARPIVPDPDSSLAPHRLRHPPPVRVWPLWFLILVLIAACGALAWFGWEERARFERELARLSGEVSNVHARFDAEEGRGEALERLESRLEALEARDEELDERLASQEESIPSRLAAIDERIDELQQRQGSIVEDAESHGAVLVATRRSLDALERAGDEGRAALGERLEALSDARARDGERLAALDERLESLEVEAGQGEALARLEAAQGELATAHGELEERLTREERLLQERLDELAARVAELGEEVEAAATSRDDTRERTDAMAGRLGALEAELRELRRSQLALSARIEALQR